MKQALRTWYNRMDSFLMSLGFTKSKEYSNLYFKVKDRRPVILLLYVDDLFLMGEEKIIVDAKRNISIKFKMKYLGMMHYFLGMEVWQSANGIFLVQGKYAMEILKIFSRDTEEIRHVGLQGDSHTYGIELEAFV